MLAGYGPPRIIESSTSTPVGKPLAKSLPAFRSRMGAVVLAEGGSLAIPSYQDLGWLVGYGVLSHCIGWLFIVSSLSEVTTVEAGLALLLQPTLSFVWDVLFFNRPLTALELVGASIALLAIYLGARPSKQM